MGRTTPSIRMALYKELARMNRLINKLPPREADKIRNMLEDIEDTLNLFMETTGAIDPLEVLLLHFIRKSIVINDGMGSRR